MVNQHTLESLAAEYEHWRQTRECRSTPIPAELRQQAVELLSTHVMGRVATALKVNHSMLKQWQKQFSASPETGFIVLPNDNSDCFSPASSTSLQITLRHPQGAEMTITGALSSDQLFRLAQSFVGSRQGEPS